MEEEEAFDVSTFDVEDMILLPAMTIEGVQGNLKNRFSKDKIYTYTGSILLSVNPYTQIEGLYAKDLATRYYGQKIGYA